MSKKQEAQQLKQSIELSVEFSQSQVESETEAAYAERRQQEKDLRIQIAKLKAEESWKAVRLIEVYAVYQLETGAKVSLKSIGLDKALLAIAKKANITDLEAQIKNNQLMLAKIESWIARMEAEEAERAALLAYNQSLLSKNKIVQDEKSTAKRQMRQYGMLIPKPSELVLSLSR